MRPFYAKATRTGKPGRDAAFRRRDVVQRPLELPSPVPKRCRRGKELPCLSATAVHDAGALVGQVLRSLSLASLGMLSCSEGRCAPEKETYHQTSHACQERWPLLRQMAEEKVPLFFGHLGMHPGNVHASERPFNQQYAGKDENGGDQNNCPNYSLSSPTRFRRHWWRSNPTRSFRQWVAT